MKTVFDYEDFVDVYTEVYAADWVDINIGGAVMKVAELPQWIKAKIHEEVQNATGELLDPLAMYARLNSPDVDTSFRIHSDSVYADVACVYYLQDGETGTALFKHPEHGSRGDGKVFTEDDGKWEVTDYFPQVENTMAIYDGDRYHSRWPHKADELRYVIVGFFTRVEK